MRVPAWFIACCLVAFGAVCNAQKKEERPLRIVSILDQPYLMLGDDGDQDNYIGFCEDLAKMVASELNRKHEIHVVKDGRYGSQNRSQPGHWDGIIGELVNNEADIAVAPLTISAIRAEVVDFTTPFQEFQLSIVMKKPDADEEDESDESLTAFSPFHWCLWLAIFCTIVGMVFISLVIEWSFKSPETHGEGFVNFLRQDSIFRPESLTGKVVRFVYFVFMIIVIGAYIASFSVQREADSQPDIAGVDSIEDLVKEDDTKFGIIAHGSTEAFLKASHDPIYSKVYDIIDREDTRVANYAEGLEKLRAEPSGSFAFILETPKAEFFEHMEPCDLTTADEEFGPERGYAIATKKNSEYSDAVNLAIMKLKEDGRLEKLIKKFWNDLECSDNEDNGGDGDDEDAIEEDDFDKLNLGEMAGLFYFLFAGLILILLVWILERRATSK